MTVQEFIQSFPEIPRDFQNELLLEEYVKTFGDYLKVARNPSNCSTQHSMENHYYLKLVSPIVVFRYGFTSKEKVLSNLQALLSRFQADPDGFVKSLLPSDTASLEVKGPGCR